MRNKSKFLIVFLLVIICLITYKYIIKRNELFKGKIERTINISYEKEQEKVDEELKKYAFDKRITIKSPKVIVDPYNSSPLTALIIFYTGYSTSIKLYINDIYMTTIESSKSHIIPVYGLRENYNNKVVIKDEKGNIKKLNITTNLIYNNAFYNYKTKFNDNTQLFLNTPNGKYAVDNSGYLSWYMNINNLKMDISSDKTIYIVDNYGNLVKTDFMGRIYKKYYSNMNFDDHQIEVLDNGNIMGILNYNLISVVDYKTGKYTNIVDVCEILKKIDNSIKIDPKEFYLNYFQYNKEDNTILLSVRGLNCIINYNLNNNEIIWIFSNNSLLSSAFDKYRLKLTKGKYVKGQHTPYLVGKYLYVFDNGIFKTGIIDSYNNETSSPVIYEINGMEIKEVYRYEGGFLSGWYGSFYERDNIKNINYGCIINNDKGKYSKIIEVDEDNNIITDLTTNFNSSLIYQSCRDTFYEEITPNYDLNTIYETSINNIEEIRYNIGTFEINYYDKTPEFKKNIRTANINESMIRLTDNGLEINIPQDFEIIFVDSNYNHYDMNINYDIEIIDLFHFYFDIFFSDIRGKYAIYIKLNDKFYNTNLVFNIN